MPTKHLNYCGKWCSDAKTSVWKTTKVCLTPPSFIPTNFLTYSTPSQSALKPLTESIQQHPCRGNPQQPSDTPSERIGKGPSQCSYTSNCFIQIICKLNFCSDSIHLQHGLRSASLPRGCAFDTLVCSTPSTDIPTIIKTLNTI